MSNPGGDGVTGPTVSSQRAKMPSKEMSIPQPLADANLFCRLTSAELLSLYRRNQISPLEVARQVLDRAKSVNEQCNAFVLIDEEGALAAARESEARWIKGAPAGALDGIPVTIKDLVSVKSWPLRMGSLSSSERPSESDAPTAHALRSAGAILIGATSTCEFGWKGVADCPLSGVTLNPWNLNLTSGGSSGGAAVAAATGSGVLHLGSDGGGSIRIPASFTGTVGIKPTFGRVPYFPPSAFAPVGHLGPITRTVEDAALMLQILSYRDIRDWHQNPLPFSPVTLIPEYSWKGARVGLWTKPVVGSIDPEIAEATRRVAQELEAAGALVEEIELPGEDLLSVFNTIWFAGAANRVRRIPAELHPKLDPGLLRIVEIGAKYSAVDYVSATTQRALFGIEMDNLLDRYDLVVSPATPIAAFEANHDVPPDSGLTVWTEWACFNFPINLSQQPACSVPVGLTKTRLPIGLQIVGPKGRDDRVLSAAANIMKLCGEWWQ